MKHEVTLIPHGTYYSWTCTCGRQSRHQLPHRAACRSGRAHERKYNAEEWPDVPHEEHKR